MSLEDRVAELESTLLEVIETFDQPQGGRNSTFEGGKVLLDIEVSDEVEELLGRAEQLLNTPEDGLEVEEEYN